MSCSTRLVSARRFQVCCSCPSCCLWWQVLCRPILGPRSPCWTTCRSLVLSLMSKPIKSSKLSNFCGRSLLSWPLLSWLPSAFLASFLASSAFFALLLFFGLFFTFLSCRFFFDFQFVSFFFFSTITPRHHSASLSFDTVWSRIAWKFWISPLSSWVMDFGLVRCWG